MFGKKDKLKQENQDIKGTNDENQQEEVAETLDDIDTTENDIQEEKTNNSLKGIKTASANQNKELEEENKKLKESLMRTLAELDNTRRRASEENEKTAKYAIGKFAEDLIPVMENFYMAFDNINEEEIAKNEDFKNFLDGIKLTQNELKKVFERNGLVRLFPMDEDFNPDLHDAIAQVESDADEGKVVQVMQAGYKIKERLLRPALVAVSKGKNII